MTKPLLPFLGLCAALASGCTKSNPVSCADDYCQDPSLPFCDIDGTLEGEPRTCIAVDCTPGEFEACRGDSELRCNAAGTNYDVGQCELGCDPASGCKVEVIVNECTPGEVRCGTGTIERCNAEGVFESEVCTAGCVPSPEPHCAYASPRFLPDICDEPAANQSTFNVASFSTDDDALCNGGIVTQTGGPEICVLRYGTIVIPNSGADVVITGGRAVAFVADTRVQVSGVLDAGGRSGVDGPGGGRIRSGGASGVGRGGGGGGFVRSGGSGGTVTATGGAQNGGGPVSPLDTALIGGTKSNSPTIGIDYSYGGGGGGALTLVACRGTVEVVGSIDVGGAGGAGGQQGNQAGAYFGGGGGGSGGYLVLQGLAINVTGGLFANGGSGGNGVPSNRTFGDFGQDGSRSISPAAPSSRFSDEGAGGYGMAAGSTASQPINGSMPTGTGRSPGGGGGAMGRIVAVTPASLLPAIATTSQSPQVISSDTLPVK